MTYQGTVKSFRPQAQDGSAKAGFGFIVCDQVQGDIYFTRQDLPDDLREALDSRILELREREVMFEVQQNDKGQPQAKQILLVGQLGDRIAGKVKSFFDAKGYGFLTCSSVEGQDVYFSKKELRQQIIELPRGAAASFTIAQQPDGKVQAKDVQFATAPAPVATVAGGMGGMGGMRKGQAGLTNMMPHMQSLGLAMQQWTKATQVAAGLPAMGQALGSPRGGPKEGEGMQGTVKNFFPDKGFGFITCSSLPSDVYYQAGDTGPTEVGSPVAFTLAISKQGKFQARDVTVGLQDGQVLDGVVRSYSAKNEYGFISVPGQPVDVYFKGNIVPSEQQDGNYTGREAQFTVKLTKDGKPQASALQFTSEAKPFTSEGKGFKRTADAVASPTAPAWKRPRVSQGQPGQVMSQGNLTGQVKSYNPNKGFGFIESPSVTGDVFFMKTSLPPAHQPNMALAGSRVSFQLTMAPDGTGRQQGQNITVM